MAKTYNDLYISAKNRLKQAGVENPAMEARLLLSYASGKAPERFLRDIALYASGELEEKAYELVTRRAGGEPLAYITGVWEFYSMPLVVSRDVLIPRIDSEVVARTAIELSIERGFARALDLCCGSGCLGLALLKNVADSKVFSADISAAALKITKQNARLNKLTRRLTCVNADALKPPPVLLSGFDLLVCNPPYIRSGDIEMLDNTVRDYEPILALDGGEDGLDFYRSILKSWKAVLNHGGYMVLECGQGQAADVSRIAVSEGLKVLSSVDDTLGIQRALVIENQRY